ncbi:MAG: hypothetical protein AAFQ94_14745 [Bacteroidota bacterium]
MDKEDKILREKIRSLDQVRPPINWSDEQLWDQIAQESKGRNQLFWWSVAAAIALLITAGSYLYLSNYLTSEDLSYSTEISQELPETPTDVGGSETEAMEFIKSECLHLADICKSPEFQSLSDELIELESEMIEIDQMIEKYGEDPSFIASKAQVEGMMSEITNQLIQMVLS